MEHSIANLKQLLERERQAKTICSELNHFTDLKSTLTTVITLIRDLSGCEAVGIRLHDDGDYPYYVYDGFPESFILMENSLCARDHDGKRIPPPDSNGHMLECMCGNILRGHFDPSFPFFTQGGSFWSNHTTALLASTTDEDRQSGTRNYCNGCGYESVALSPVKVRGEIIGLIQMNDMRTGMFTEDFIAYLEMIAQNIGLAVKNSTIYSRLQGALDEIKVLKGILPICCICKKIRDNKGYWHAVESYIRDHTEADFSHGVCPVCMKNHYEMEG